MVTVKPEEILEFWFGNALTSPEQVGPRSELWFSQNDEFDSQIQHRFDSLPEQAARGELDAWRGEGSSALALVLVLDQFPRNLYRHSARAFEFDPPAREVALESISRGFDEALHPLQAAFLYLPLEHAEDIGLQERSVQLIEQLTARAPAGLRPRFEQFTTYARRHRDVIHRFGRFPHRNGLLNRKSTPAEIVYLESGGDTFG
jgi:uncharacterized protein (DUF924 family)